MKNTRKNMVTWGFCEVLGVRQLSGFFPAAVCLVLTLSCALAGESVRKSSWIDDGGDDDCRPFLGQSCRELRHGSVFKEVDLLCDMMKLRLVDCSGFELSVFRSSIRHSPTPPPPPPFPPLQV